MTAEPLNIASLPALERRGVRIPSYDVESAGISQIHIGPGGFHRGHQAVYADDLLATGVPDAGICSISLRSSMLRDRLSEQDGLYSISDEPGTIRIIGSIRELIVASESPRTAVSRFADPTIRVVTMTVTEAGYCWAADREGLDIDDAGVRHDIDNPDEPVTMPGLVVAALSERHSRGEAPFALVPCDNLNRNGQVLRTVLTSLAATTSRDLADWIASEVPIHTTMVDRMVPASDESTVREARNLGVIDAAPIQTEPYSQWTIETVKGSGIPSWNLVGADFVDDVEPYERRKLRTLNAAHSTAALLGLNRGHILVSDAVADDRIQQIMGTVLFDEIKLADLDIADRIPQTFDDYARITVERFANPNLGYTNAKVASDGAQKLQQRILPTISELLDRRDRIDGLSMVVAAWMWSTWGSNPERLEISDPWFDETVGSRLDRTQEPAAYATALIDETPLFGQLTGSRTLLDATVAHLDEIWSTGHTHGTGVPEPR